MTSRADAARLYLTGEYSNLIVRTPTKDFHVHQEIVSEHSPYFQRACRRLPETGIIRVNESEAIMHIIFQHMYRFELALPLEDLSEPCTPEQIAYALHIVNQEGLMQMVELCTAARKFGINGLYMRAQTATQLCTYLNLDVHNLVVMACRAHGRELVELALDPVLRFHTLIVLVFDFPSVVETPDAWDILRTNEELLQLTAECRYLWVSLQLQGSFRSELRTPLQFTRILEFFDFCAEKLRLSLEGPDYQIAFKFLRGRQVFQNAQGAGLGLE